MNISYLKAVLQVNPAVAMVDGEGRAFDNHHNLIEIDQALLEAALLQTTAEEELRQAKASRAAAYRSEADPLFFKAQRGEATTDEWTAKVAEIKARFPYPAEGGAS